jgi:peptide-methionine (S)-S-oxide reductase
LTIRGATTHLVRGPRRAAGFEVRIMNKKIATPHRAVSHPLLAVLALAMIASAATPARAQDDSIPVLPLPALDEQPGQSGSPETIVLAGGCFWGMQGVFSHVKGVVTVVAGYTGGAANTAQYKIVARGDSGHAESVRITFDPHRISLGRLLQIYFSVAHDPTTLDYQDYDSGPQYRSAIFPETKTQARIAKAYIAQLDKAHVFKSPIVTSLEPGHTFYRAEDFHQNFVARDSNYPYVVAEDLPKLDALKRMYPDLYRDQPLLVPITHKVMTP